MAISQQRLSLEEFLKLPEAEPALEYLHGAVTQKVSPKVRHATLQPHLAELFNSFARPVKLALAFTELRATFGGASLVSDVAVYRWDRIPVDEDGDVVDDFFEPPDIAVEILPPGQTVRDLIAKCVWYVDNGVRIALFVNPRDRWVIVFRPNRRTDPLRGPDRIDLDDVLPDFNLTVQDLFGSLRVR